MCRIFWRESLQSLWKLPESLLTYLKCLIFTRNPRYPLPNTASQLRTSVLMTSHITPRDSVKWFTGSHNRSYSAVETQIAFWANNFLGAFLLLRFCRKKKKQSSNINKKWKKKKGCKRASKRNEPSEPGQPIMTFYKSHDFSIFDCGDFTAPKKPDELSLSLLGFVGFVVVGPFIFGYMGETKAFLVGSLKAANPLKQYLLQRFDFVLHDTSGLIESAPQWFWISLKTGITFPSSKV